MHPKLLTTLLAGVLVLAGCAKHESDAGSPSGGGKKSTADLVPENERSRHFAAVNRRLELGGTLYGYVDIDGDARKVAESLKGILEKVAMAKPEVAPFVNQDYAALFQKLGVEDIKAVGVSSVPDGTGYFRNRTFFYTPNGRHGLLAGLGGAPAPFAYLALAPANTDVYSETEIDLPAMYTTVRDVIAQVGGEPARTAFDQGLQKAGEAAMISWLKLINATKGHLVLVMRFDPGKTMPLPGGMVMPAISFLLRIDGVASAVEDALRGTPMLAASADGATHYYEMKQPLPLEGLRPVIAAEGSTLFVATTREFLNECRTQKTNLGQDAEFKKALSLVGSDGSGNGIGFVSPRFFKRLHEFASLNPNSPVSETVGPILEKLPNPDRPFVTVRTNESDGILVRSYWDRSLKQDVALMSVYNPVTVGLLAAMAVPAFQKVQTASQEKAVMNNLRQLGAAADQFYLENGVTRANYEDLVGPKKIIKAIIPVMGEDYHTVRFRSGQPLRIRLRDGRTVEYQP